MRALMLALIVALVVLVAWVGFANWGQTVTVNFGFQKVHDTSLAMVIFVATVAGVVFIGTIALIEGVTLRVENMRLRRRLRRLEDEITDLRNLALQSSAASPSAPRADQAPRSLSDPS